MEIRVAIPKRVPAKFGIPAAPFEPVEIAVEDESGCTALCARQPLDHVESGQIPVEAADNVQRLGVDFRLSRKTGRIVAVVRRAVAARAPVTH